MNLRKKFYKAKIQRLIVERFWNSKFNKFKYNSKFKKNFFKKKKKFTLKTFRKSLSKQKKQKKIKEKVMLKKQRFFRNFNRLHKFPKYSKKHTLLKKILFLVFLFLADLDFIFNNIDFIAFQLRYLINPQLISTTLQNIDPYLMNLLLDSHRHIPNTCLSNALNYFNLSKNNLTNDSNLVNDPNLSKNSNLGENSNLSKNSDNLSKNSDNLSKNSDNRSEKRYFGSIEHFRDMIEHMVEVEEEILAKREIARLNEIRELKGKAKVIETSPHPPITYKFQKAEDLISRDEAGSSKNPHQKSAFIDEDLEAEFFEIKAKYEKEPTDENYDNMKYVYKKLKQAFHMNESRFKMEKEEAYLIQKEQEEADLIKKKQEQEEADLIKKKQEEADLLLQID